MPELRRAVRVLKEFVANDKARPNPDVLDALDIYSSACRMLNERLSECCRLAGLGQRSEALRQLKIEPDLLNLCREIQFEKDDWLPEVCKDFDLPIPPRVDMESAKRLNEAYQLEEEQQALLREHRLLALGREPLRRRMDVLRLIVKSANREVFWQDDLAAYEAKRIDLIRHQINEPQVRENWELVDDLYAESTNPVWVTAVPLELLDTIRKARTRLLRKAFSDQIEPVLSGLVMAIADVQTDRVEELVKRADSLRKKYEHPSNSVLMKPIEEAYTWLHERKVNQKRWELFQRAVEDLREALNNRVEWHYVQQYYVIAGQYGEGWKMPTDVAELFRKRTRSRQMFWISSAIAGFAVAAIVLLIKL